MTLSRGRAEFRAPCLSAVKDGIGQLRASGVTRSLHHSPGRKLDFWRQLWHGFRGYSGRRGLLRSLLATFGSIINWGCLRFALLLALACFAPIFLGCLVGRLRHLLRKSLASVGCGFVSARLLLRLLWLLRLLRRLSGRLASCGRNGITRRGVWLLPRGFVCYVCCPLTWLRVRRNINFGRGLCLRRVCSRAWLGSPCFPFRNWHILLYRL
mmetsp:Transcript_51111/g.119163  ORF Transcript_51111/g.119163 Transcript_51111/m.119163 type:complete len:211 (-) Transcript_51111:343-975(-)